MRRLLLPAICAALAPYAHALVDTNANGLSDIWEKAFNGNALFSAANPDHIPTSDPDGDGWTNLQEATAGTNPFDANNAQGILTPSVSHTPAIREPAPPGAGIGQPAPPPPSGDPEDPFGGGTGAGTTSSNPLEIRRPARFTLTWPTVAGKAYRVDHSPDLALWTPSSGFFMGEGEPLTYTGEAIHADNTEPAKLFYRVIIEDADSDGDSLTDWEEGNLGTDPFSKDTDRDGISDSADSAPLVNSLHLDPDGSHGLPASLATGLLARWDLEATHIAPTQGPYYTLARYADSVGANHIVPFQSENKPEGMPSKGAGTNNTGLGFLCPPRTLLHNRTTYSVSQWVKIDHGTITAARPLAALFTHHRRLPQPVPYHDRYTIDINGMWIERLANGSQILKAGTSNYINHVPGTTQLTGGTWTFNGVTTTKPAGTFDDGKYHHFLLVRTSGSVTLYMDGALIGANANVPLAPINAPYETATGISIGRLYGEPAESGLNDTHPQATRGTFDRIRVWSRTVTAAEAESLYKQDIENDGLWDITEERTRTWDDHNLNAIVEYGEFTFAANPLHADPADSDHDTDEITSVREQNETLTDIAKPDTDNDGLPDGFEDSYRPTLNPLVVNDGTLDPESDGLTTAQEYAGGTNPTVSDAPLYPPTWMSVERSLRYDFDDYGLAYPTAPKKLTTTATWPGAVPTNEDPLTNMIPFANLGNIIAQRQPFPATFPPNKLSPDLEAGGSATTVPSPPCHHASLSHRRIIVKVATATPEPREFKAILLTERTIDGIEQPDEAETLTLTVPPNATQSYPYDLTPTFTDGGLGSGAYSETVKQAVIKYDITEVISDQIAGNEANKLPTAHYGGHPNNPMLMGTRSGQNAKLRIGIKVDPKHAPGMFVGVRVVGTTQILGAVAFVPVAISKLALNFKAQDDTKLYEIVVGYDTDKDGSFDPAEVKDVFQKTPKIDKNGDPYSGGDTTYAFMDKILIATRNDFLRARHETAEYDFDLELTHDTGSDLMGMFSRGDTTVPGVGATVGGQILDANVIPSPQGLSHPLGATWNVTNQANTFKLVFPFNSTLGSDLHSSAGIRVLRDRLIMANKPDLLASATSTQQESDPIAFTDDRIAFEVSDLRSNVHLALGKCDAHGTITFRYRESIGGNLEILEYKMDGYVTDLYDWAYGTNLKIGPIQLDLTKDAAITQAAFAMLTDPRWPFAGRVFFTNVEIKTGWVLLGQSY